MSDLYNATDTGATIWKAGGWFLGIFLAVCVVDVVCQIVGGLRK